MSTIFFYWDIRPEKDREYMDFYFNECLPGMSRVGITVADVWLKVAGEGPQIMALGESDGPDTARQAIESADFRSLETRLQTYVENYSKRLARRNIKSEGR